MPRIQIMIGRTLGGATVAILQGLVVIIIAVVAGFRVAHYAGLAWALVFMGLIGLMFTALGTALASVLPDFQGFQLIINLLVMPIFFLSGALFPLIGLPKLLDVIARLDPLSYGVDGLRTALTGVGHFGLGTDLAVVSGLCAALLLLGGWLFSRIEL